MSPLNSWILILALFSTIAFVTTLFYVRGQEKYIGYLEKEVLENKPPF